MNESASNTKRFESRIRTNIVQNTAYLTSEEHIQARSSVGNKPYANQRKKKAADDTTKYRATLVQIENGAVKFHQLSQSNTSWRQEQR